MSATVRLQNRAPQILACLAQPERLKIAGDVARGCGLQALRTAYGATATRKHLDRLQACGLVEIDGDRLVLTSDVFTQAREELRLLRSASRGPAPLDRSDINDCFENGRLRELPQNPRQLAALLEWIAERYFIGGPWTEREVDLVLKTFAVDHATLRRQLVDHGYLCRTSDGSEYRPITLPRNEA